MIGRLAGAVVLSLSVSAGAASAATIYASEVTGTKAGVTTSCSIAAASTDRSDLCNALGGPDATRQGGGFLSTGNYDMLKFTFGGPFQGPIEVFEITWGTPGGYVEVADFTFVLLGEDYGAFGNVIEEVTNTDGEASGDTWKIAFDLPAGATFSELWVVDRSDLRDGRRDGFDIDAISAQLAVVPLPAAGLLLLGALGGLVAVRRRRG